MSMEYRDIQPDVWELLDGIVNKTVKSFCGPSTGIALDDGLIEWESGVYRLTYPHGFAAYKWREQQLKRKKPTVKKTTGKKAGRPSKPEEDKMIFRQYRIGLEKDRWESVAEFLRKEYPTMKYHTLRKKLIRGEDYKNKLTKSKRS